MTTALTPVPTIPLANGVAMPRIGLGTWPMQGHEAAEAVRSALEIGYRLIDTAENYGNEDAVGEGMRASGLKREDIFLTTKFNRAHHSVGGVRETCEASLARLGTDYIDLFLIHWPNPDQDRYVEAFEGLQRVLEAGLVRAIGTSNFKPAHLEKLFAAGMVPHLNQVQLDPFHPRPDVLAVHQARGIVTEAWGPIGRGSDLLDAPSITAIAQEHGVTPSQVVLRWHLQSDHVTVPKSASPQRQAENLDILGFALSDEEMAQLNSLGRPDPDMLDSDSFGH